MKSRLEKQRDFAAKHGWGEADLFPLSSDASFRSYCRLEQGGKTRLLMDAPPPEEDLGAYLKVQQHLESLGLKPPAVYGADEKDGFAIIEDFGSGTFTNLLKEGADRETLYRLAVDVLIHLHHQGGGADIDLPPYDMDALLKEADLFIDWFFPEVYSRDVTEEERSAWRQAWQQVLSRVSEDRSTLVLRDYHVDNLMRLDAGEGVLACGLLDFQDALIGSAAYDVMSLVQDARLDVPVDMAEDLVAQYLEACPDINPSQFAEEIAILGAQRHAKVAGIFVRLYRRDEKPVYLEHIPRVLRLLGECLQHPALAPVHSWFKAHCPDFQEKVVRA